MVNNLIDRVSLKLLLDGGSQDGKQIIKSKRFRYVKSLAENENIYNTGIAISRLYKKDLMTVNKIVESELIKE